MVEVFTRKASGLVRSVSTRDVFIYNLGIINLGFGISYILRWGTPYYFGADLIRATLIVAFFCTIQALVYYLFSVALPRSGGEYVFISRALHPSLGFAFSFSTTLWMIFYVAWSAANFASLGLSSFFTILGLHLKNPHLAATSVWLESPMGIFVVGTALIIVAGSLFILGMRPYLRVQFWAFVVAMLGIAATFVVLLSTSHPQFVEAFNAFARSSIGEDAYDRVFAIARQSGWRTPGFNWPATLAVLVWPFYPLAYSFMSTSFGSEIRRVERSQLIGMPGAVVFAAMVFLALITLADRVMGLDFLGAIGWNALAAPEGSTKVTPWFHLLASLPSGSTLLVLLITLGFVMWTYFWIGGDILYTTRMIFAWALDRVAPDRLSAVHPTLRTPVNSILLSMAMSEIFLALYAFTPWFTTLVGTLAITLTFLMIGISATVFPYTKPEMYSNSPVARYRIGSIPVISLLGVVTTVFMAFMAYRLFNDEIASGPKGTALVTVGAPLLFGFACFYLARFWQKKRGVDISLAYKEIPIE